MAASDVSICSNALLLLGAQPIASFNDTNDRARLASNLFATVRDSTQRRHPWNCLITRVVLSPDTTAPAFDWDYAYALPEDYMRAVSVGMSGDEDDFKIEGLQLLTDANPCYLRYVANNTNPATWDAMLVQGMTLAMAEAMAYPITQSAALRDSFAAELAAFMKQARAVDGQDDTPETLGDSPLLQARFRSGGAGWRG